MQTWRLVVVDLAVVVGQVKVGDPWCQIVHVSLEGKFAVQICKTYIEAISDGIEFLAELYQFSYNSFVYRNHLIAFLN